MRVVAQGRACTRERGAGRYPARVLLGESVTVTVVVIVCALVLVASVIGIVRLSRGKKE